MEATPGRYLDANPISIGAMCAHGKSQFRDRFLSFAAFYRGLQLEGITFLCVTQINRTCMPLLLGFVCFLGMILFRGQSIIKAPNFY